MILQQRATVKRCLTIPELRPRRGKTGTRRPLPVSSGGQTGWQETQPEDPVISRDAKAQDGNRIRIVSIDNHPLFREGIATILNEAPEMVLVSHASTGQEAIQLFREHQPDIMLMEIRLPDMPGIDALLAIRAEFPAARIMILTIYDGDVEVHRALAAGASGYLLKNAPPGELLQHIRRVHSGHKGIEPRLAAKLAEHMGEAPLTAREVQVLTLVAGGNRNREIAELLCITEETVKVHVRRIMEKLGARDRTQAVAIAVRRGVIEL